MIQHDFRMHGAGVFLPSCLLFLLLLLRGGSVNRFLRNGGASSARYSAD
jgi:hypothetical protein